MAVNWNPFDRYFEKRFTNGKILYAKNIDFFRVRLF